MGIADQWRSFADEFGRLQAAEDAEIAGGAAHKRLQTIPAANDWQLVGDVSEILQAKFRELGNRAGALLNHPLPESPKLAHWLNSLRGFLLAKNSRAMTPVGDRGGAIIEPIRGSQLYCLALASGEAIAPEYQLLIRSKSARRFTDHGHTNHSFDIAPNQMRIAPWWIIHDWSFEAARKDGTLEVLELVPVTSPLSGNYSSLSAELPSADAAAATRTIFWNGEQRTVDEEFLAEHPEVRLDLEAIAAGTKQGKERRAVEESRAEIRVKAAKDIWLNPAAYFRNAERWRRLKEETESRIAEYSGGLTVVRSASGFRSMPGQFSPDGSIPVKVLWTMERIGAALDCPSGIPPSEFGFEVAYQFAILSGEDRFYNQQLIETSALSGGGLLKPLEIVAEVCEEGAKWAATSNKEDSKRRNDVKQQLQQFGGPDKNADQTLTRRLREIDFSRVDGSKLGEDAFIEWGLSKLAERQRRDEFAFKIRKDAALALEAEFLDLHEALFPDSTVNHSPWQWAEVIPTSLVSDLQNPLGDFGQRWAKTIQKRAQEIVDSIPGGVNTEDLLAGDPKALILNADLEIVELEREQEMLAGGAPPSQPERLKRAAVDVEHALQYQPSFMCT